MSFLVQELRSRPVDGIDTAAVLAVLKPLWQAKPETAYRLRGRIEAVLDAAKAQGHRRMMAARQHAAFRKEMRKMAAPCRRVFSRSMA